MEKVRWGVLSTAKIGAKQVIPAMQASEHCDMVGIASRDLDRARMVAAELGMPKAYGSYEELLADPEIDAVYIPLPNHLHVPWAIRALEAGKHVLCEKPIGLSAAEAEELLAVSMRHPHLKVMEAFMYRHHPQWQRARQLAREGAIGDLKTVQVFFSYYNDDPTNIRNMPGTGGGGLMDIGCYCISAARFLFDAEPQRVMGIQEVDPDFKVDRMTSAVMDFGSGTATWTCATQLAAYQRAHILGTEGRIEVEIPFNPPSDRACWIWHQRGGKLEEILFDLVNHYTIQGDLFSLAVLNDTAEPTPLRDAVANMQAIEAVARSARLGRWV
ncbi:MAG: Gfo/Idh/MocA family protein [Anaerolineae bacterium]|jgi:predicted dehydrogenase